MLAKLSIMPEVVLATWYIIVNRLASCLVNSFIGKSSGLVPSGRLGRLQREAVTTCTWMHTKITELENNQSINNELESHIKTINFMVFMGGYLVGQTCMVEQ